MGLRSRLARLLFPIAKGENHPSVSVVENDTIEDPVAEQADLSLKTVWEYAAIRCIATHASSLDLKVAARTEGQFAYVPAGDPARRIVDKPNADMTWMQFAESVFWYAELYGHVPLHVVRSGGLITSIKPVHPRYLSADKTLKGKTKVYAFEDPNNQEHTEIPSEDLIFYRYFHPDRPVFGMSASEAARKQLLLEWHANQYNVVFFSNNALPSVVLKTSQLLTKTVRRRLQEMWRVAFGSSKKAHGFAILTGGLEVQSIAPKHTDMAFLELKRRAMEEILAARGVPPIMLGLESQLTKGNAAEMRHVFFTGTLRPKFDLLLEVLNDRVFHPLGLHVDADYDDFLTTAQTLHERKTEVRGYWRDGLIRRNEARLQLGFPPDDTQAGDIYVTDIRTGQPAASQPKELITDLSPSLPLPMPVDAIYGQTGRRAEMLKGMLEGVRLARTPLKTLFIEIAADIAKYDGGLKGKRLLRRLSDDVEKRRGPLSSWYASTFAAAAELGSDVFQVPVQKQILVPTMVDSLKAILSQELLAQRSLEDHDPALIVSRVEALAISESFGAVNHAANMVYRMDPKVRDVQWWCAKDAWSRPSHVALHGSIRPKEAEFFDGRLPLHYPHDSSVSPEFTLGCRCLHLPAHVGD